MADTRSKAGRQRMRRPGALRRRGTLLPALIAAAVLAVAGVAWACTPTGYVELEPTYGPPGTVAMADGRLPSDAEVRIRWGSETGRVLAHTQGPDFAVEFVVPTVPYETYTVVAEASNGAERWKASAQFTVTDRVAPKRTSGQPIENYDSSTGEAESGTNNSDANRSKQQTGRPFDGSRQQSRVPQPQPVDNDNAISPAAASAPAPAASEATPDPPGSPGSSGPPAASQPDSLASTSAGVGAAPPEIPRALRTVVPDLWSGFDTRRVPSESGALTGPETAQEPSAPLLMGMVLLGFGAVLGIAGMSIAVAHLRRGSVARASSRFG